MDIEPDGTSILGELTDDVKSDANRHTTFVIGSHLVSCPEGDNYVCSTQQCTESDDEKKSSQNMNSKIEQLAAQQVRLAIENAQNEIRRDSKLQTYTFQVRNLNIISILSQ